MNTYTKHGVLFSSLLVAVSCMATSASQSPFNDPLYDMMERIEKQMERMRESMHVMGKDIQEDQPEFSKNFLDITEDKQKHTVTITVNNLSLDSMDASIYEDENRLVVKAPGTTVSIAARDTLLAISVSQTQQRNSEKEGQTAHFASSQSNSFRQLLSSPVSFAPETIKLDYDQEEKILRVTLQTAHPTSGAKKIPVTVHKKKQENIKS